MRFSQLRLPVQLSRLTVLVCGLALFASGYATAWRVLYATKNLIAVAQASAEHEGELGPFMMRNAYHFATLFHAARAGQWDLAAHETEELGENLQDAGHAVQKYAPLFKQYQDTALQALEQAITARQPEQFHTAFQAAVAGCNTCHTATQHAFIVIPQEPPQLSILALSPAGK
jgi:hypothetical protein